MVIAGKHLDGATLEVPDERYSIKIMTSWTKHVNYSWSEGFVLVFLFNTRIHGLCTFVILFFFFFFF